MSILSVLFTFLLWVGGVYLIAVLDEKIMRRYRKIQACRRKGMRK